MRPAHTQQFGIFSFRCSGHFHLPLLYVACVSTFACYDDLFCSSRGGGEYGETRHRTRMNFTPALPAITTQR